MPERYIDSKKISYLYEVTSFLEALENLEKSTKSEAVREVSAHLQKNSVWESEKKVA